MATVSFAPALKQQYFDANGNPLAGGLIYTYQSGTTTPQSTYTDSTGSVANANPVVLDANGEANIWLDVSLSYKFVIKDSGGSTLRTVDGIIGLATNNSVVTASIQDGAVTTPKIADDAVTAAKLADDASVDANRAVTTNHIRNAAVTGQKIGYAVSASKTTTYSISATDDTINCDATSAGFTVTLPTAVGITGRRYTIIRTDNTPANSLTIATTSSQTINGATTRILSSQNAVITVESDGANWNVVAIRNNYLAATSSVKTPTASGNFLAMTGNSVTLTPGSWTLSGQVLLSNSGAAGYSNAFVYWGTTNGADSGTVPTAPTMNAGYEKTGVACNSDGLIVTCSVIRMTVTSNTTVYLVPSVFLTTAANARVTAYVYAEQVG